MTDETVLHYSQLTLLVMVAGFFAVALWESFRPCRQPTQPTPKRWLLNFSLYAFGLLGYRWLLPLSYLAAAILARQQGWGVFQQVQVHPVAAFLMTLLVIDLLRYGFHRLLHNNALLWRFHAVHHSDPDYDLTLSLRFHPIESLLLWYCTLGLILLLGAPPLAVLIIDALSLLNGQFTHGNIRLPPALDTALRWLLVTPNMHRIHHSKIQSETDSNYGSLFSFWDRWFGSYTKTAHCPLQDLPIGLSQVPPASAMNLGKLIADPFRRQSSSVQTRQS